MGKGLHKVFKTVVKDISQELTPFVDRTLSIAARLHQAGYLTCMDVVKILIVVEVRLFQ